jgi:hypothetical protein
MNRVAATGISVAAVALATSGVAHGARFEVAPAHAEAASAAAHSRTLVGVTSQFPCRLDDSVTCGGVNVVMDRRLKKIKHVIIGWEASCQSPGAFLWSATRVTRPRLARSRGGASFDESGQILDDIGNGLFVVTDVTISGRLRKNGSVVTGRFRALSAILRDDGQIDSCDTGSVRWSAKRTGRGG